MLIIGRAVAGAGASALFSGGSLRSQCLCVDGPFTSRPYQVCSVSHRSSVPFSEASSRTRFPGVGVSGYGTPATSSIHRRLFGFID